MMTLGAYIYAYATRHRALPRILREDVGLRLMATGLVIAYTTGFADVLRIGSNFGPSARCWAWSRPPAWPWGSSSSSSAFSYTPAVRPWRVSQPEPAEKGAERAARPRCAVGPPAPRLFAQTSLDFPG